MLTDSYLSTEVRGLLPDFLGAILVEDKLDDMERATPYTVDQAWQLNAALTPAVLACRCLLDTDTMCARCDERLTLIHAAMVYAWRLDVLPPIN